MMRRFNLWALLSGLAHCHPVPPAPAPVPPDATDAAPVPLGDAASYAACCAAMAAAGCDDGGSSCAPTLEHIVRDHFIASPCACRACGLACQ